MHSRFCNLDVAAACRRAGACTSLRVQMNPHVATAIGSSSESAWVPIPFSEVLVAPDTGAPVFDVQAAGPAASSSPAASR